MLKKEMLLIVSSLMIISSIISQKIGASYQNNYSYSVSNFDEIESYLKSNPDDIDTKRTLAFNYLIKKEYEHALSLLDSIYEENPQDTQTLHQRIIANFRLENYELAKEDSKTLINFNNHNSVAKLNSAQIEFMLGNKEKMMNLLKETYESSKYNDLVESEIQFYEYINEMHRKLEQYLKENQNFQFYFELGNTEFLESNLRIKALEEALNYANSLKEKETIETIMLSLQ